MGFMVACPFYMLRFFMAIYSNVVTVFGVSMVATILSIFGWFLYQCICKKRSQLFEVPHVYNEENDYDVGDCLEGDNMHGEGSNNDPILDPKHKIFLSHSGAQKEFVDHLCKALEDRWHYPFFDRRHESLPKGERFAELIVRATEQCEMLIVVVSNEYFMSKWPMIELSAFVKAHKLHCGANIGPKILPLFYGLSVSDLDNEGMRKKWFQQWKTFAKADAKKRIVVKDWKNALDVLRSFNGLSYDRNSKEVVAYEDKIVSHVCKSIVPDIQWDDSHVQGKSNICKVIRERIEGIGVSQKYKVKVVGIYGVGGIGKSTTCKTLCNELSNNYEGRVCHIEFPSNDSKELFQKVSRDLTKKSMEVIQLLNEGECKDILCKSLFKKRTFLAIDNISDNHRSIEEAKMFLEFPYHKDSLVVVRARSQSVLRLLGLDGDACFEMLELGEVDAVNLFLLHAAGGRQFFEDEEKHNIMTCVKRCYFSKGIGEGHHYHPLALKALGLQLGCHGENPSLWVKYLPWVRTFNFFSRENPVFDILRSSFDLLSSRDQALFMDVGCFSKTTGCPTHENLIEWLCFAHKQGEEEIALRLECLKRKGLLQDVDLRCGRIRMHDLYLEFAKLEAKGSFHKTNNFRERMWVYIDDGDLIELESKPEGGCWHKLKRLTITQDIFPSKHGWIGSMEGMTWDYFSNVEVLQLSGLHWGHGAFNLEGLLRLRILLLNNVSKIDRIEGLEKLKHLTDFEYFSYKKHGGGVQIVGKLPSSLIRLGISGKGMVFGLDPFAQCHNLSKLSLVHVEAHSLDFSNCRFLKSVKLCYIQKLQTILGLVAYTPSNLHSLDVLDCKDLIEIHGIDHLYGVKKLYLKDCEKLKVPSLLALTELQVLHIEGQQKLVVSSKDCFPRQLQELRWCWSQLSKGLNLSGLNLLEVLDLSFSNGWISLAELGNLPALRYLNLSNCKHLQRLPNLTISRNLTELNLQGCYELELHENDIQMLCELPLLQPVPFFGEGDNGMFKLALARGKVLFQASSYWDYVYDWEYWNAAEWEERDLGAPPIKIKRRGTWEVDLVDNCRLK